jgi:hypothetical protein
MLKVGCCIMAKKLQRFQLASYKMMNQLKTIDITRNRSSFENTIKLLKQKFTS